MYDSEIISLHWCVLEWGLLTVSVEDQASETSVGVLRHDLLEWPHRFYEERVTQGV